MLSVPNTKEANFMLLVDLKCQFDEVEKSCKSLRSGQLTRLLGQRLGGPSRWTSQKNPDLFFKHFLCHLIKCLWESHLSEEGKSLQSPLELFCCN